MTNSNILDDKEMMENQTLLQKHITAIHNKIKNNKTLTKKEIDSLIELHWLEWTCKYELSPCGDLTYQGKLEYINDNRDTILELIDEFPEVLED